MNTTEINKFIGDKIRKYRKLTGVTQEELAAILKISRTSMVNMEQGRQSCPLYRVPLLCATLGMTPNDLFPMPKIKVTRTISWK